MSSAPSNPIFFSMYHLLVRDRPGISSAFWPRDYPTTMLRPAAGAAREVDVDERLEDRHRRPGLGGGGPHRDVQARARRDGDGRLLPAPARSRRPREE